MTFISVHFAATVKNLVPAGDRVYSGEEVTNISHQFRAHSTEACRGGGSNPLTILHVIPPLTAFMDHHLDRILAFERFFCT